jgi:hypothetical protein
MNKFGFAAVFLALALPSSNSYAPQLAPRINPEPLEPPSPIAVSEHAEPKQILGVVTAELKRAGFVIQSRDRRTFVVEGRKFYASNRPKNYDRIIVWLARSAATADDIEVFLLYGRYVEIIGTQTRVQRIVLTSDDQEQNVGEVSPESGGSDHINAGDWAMKQESVRAAIALTVVGVFMGITAFLAIFPLVTQANVELTAYSDFFVKTASVYTGIVGVIIGYYFARSEQKKLGADDGAKSEPGGQSQSPPSGSSTPSMSSGGSTVSQNADR